MLHVFLNTNAHSFKHCGLLAASKLRQRHGPGFMVTSGVHHGRRTQPELSKCPQPGVPYRHHRPLQGDHHLSVSVPHSLCVCHPCAPGYPHHDLTCYSPWLLAARSSCQVTGSLVSVEPAAAWGFAKVGAGVTSGGCWG